MIVVTVLLAFLSIIFLILTVVFYMKSNMYKQQCGKIVDFESETNTLKEANDSLKEVNIKLKAELDMVKSSGDIVDKRLKEQFKNISNEILKEQKKESRENIEDSIKPFKENLERFNKKIEETNKENIEKGAMLEANINNLIKNSNRLSEETNKLSSALTSSNKMQGNWGENILKNILDIAGLEENISYKIQENLELEDGKRGLTDVTIFLPNGGSIIIDSKVSLKSYIEYVNCEDDSSKKMYLEAHINSIKNHVKILSSKEYNRFKKGALDFVIMFIPNESAYMLALNSEPTLIYDTFSKNKIAIATPSSLLPILRTVTNMYKIEKQSKNVDEIAKVGGELYDRFVQFIELNDEVKKSINKALEFHEKATKKLGSADSGGQSIYTSVDKLKTLGAKTTKELNSNLIE